MAKLTSKGRYYNLVGKEEITSFASEMKKAKSIYWFNHKKYPFEPYKEVENYPWVQPMPYGLAIIKQIEELYAYDLMWREEAIEENNVKYLDRTKKDWEELTSRYNKRFELYDTNPEWFI